MFIRRPYRFETPNYSDLANGAMSINLNDVIAENNRYVSDSCNHYVENFLANDLAIQGFTMDGCDLKSLSTITSC